MKKKLVTPPAIEPISLDEAKLNLRVDHNDENNNITQMITAARRYCEEHMGRVFMEQTWELYPTKSERFYTLEHPTPITEVTEVKYLMDDGSTVILDPADYRQDCRSMTLPAQIWITDPPDGKIDQYQPITITVTAGVQTTDELDANIIRAIHMAVSDYYEQRESWSGAGSGVGKEITMGNMNVIHALLQHGRILSV